MLVQERNQITEGSS